jgi:hypothetical protein
MIALRDGGFKPRDEHVEEDHRATRLFIETFEMTNHAS